MFWNKYLADYAGSDFPASMWKWVFSLVVVEIILKGFSLWRSARRGEKGWFIVLLIVNSLGILPVIYLLTHPETKSKKK